jgi:hypothetical protein
MRNVGGPRRQSRLVVQIYAQTKRGQTVAWPGIEVVIKEETKVGPERCARARSEKGSDRVGHANKRGLLYLDSLAKVDSRKQP